MPNDLTAKRNLLNSRDDVRSESQRQKLTSSSFTASIWTISGVVLVACGNIEDFLGIDDGGGGGGRSVHVQNSPIQGARLYFDADGDGTVSMDERAAQDAQHPQGFVTDATGEAHGIPGDLYGKAFVAVLDGAFDADTGAEFPANTEYQSIPNAAGDHLLASPITDYVANQLAENLMPEEVDPAIRAEVAELLGLPAATDENQRAANEARVDALLDDVSDHTRYDGSSGVDVLARYLAENANPMEADVVAEVARVLGDDPAEALTVTSPSTLPPVMIGEHDTYIATIEAESLVHAVTYSIESADSGAFTVSNSGVISVREGMTPTEGMTTLSVAVTSGGTTQMVEVAVTFTTNLPELTPPTSTSTEIGEDTAAGTALISGIMAPMGIDADDFVIRVPSDANLAADLAANFDIMEDGGAFNLVLATGANLDYEAIPESNGARVITLQVSAKNSDGVSSAPLELTITVTGVNEAPVFTTTGQNLIAEIPETQTAADGTILTVEAVDADGGSANNAVRYSITAGDPDGLFFIDPNTGAIRVADGMTLNYDTTPATTGYMLEITATEGGDNPPAGALTDTATVTITVTDANDIVPMVMPPSQGGTFRVRTTDGLSEAEITQKSAASTGYSITITDADTVNEFTFGVSDRRFDFVETSAGSGVWDLTLMAGEAVPEQESQTATPNTITLTYYVDDGANRVPGGTVTLEVVATPVEFTSPATETVAENNATNADVLLVQAMSENDDGTDSPITSYMFLDANDMPTTTDQGFSIDSDSGQITVDGVLDYETTPSYTLRVRATDTPDPNVQGDEAEINDQMITITVGDVNDNAPIFTVGQDVAATIPESQTAADGTILSITADDADGTAANRNVIYSIESGDPDGLFFIDPSSGDLRVADGMTLNYDTDPATTSYTLMIGASDGRDASGTADTVIDAMLEVTITLTDVNDVVPMVTPPPQSGVFRVRTTGTDDASGNAAAGTGYRITIDDADTNNVFTFNVSDPRFEFQAQGSADVTWELFLKAGEEVPEAEGGTITLTYHVNDGVANSVNVGQTTVMLNVVDTPVEFAPVTAAALMADENDGDWTLTVMATSLGSNSDGSNSDIASYEIVEVLDENDMVVASDGVFTIADRTIGKISISAGLDYETSASYTLVIRATDTVESGVLGDTADTNTERFTINLRDVNEHNPVFDTKADDPALSAHGDTVELAENAAAGTVVAQVRATDADGTSTVEYGITAGAGGNFVIDEETGVITVASGATLDYDGATKSYTILVRAYDGPSTDPNAAESDEQQITINLTDVNDNPPMVTAPAGEIRTTTGNAAETPTGYSITVTDADTVGTLMVDSDDERFRFDRDGTTDTWNLILLANQAVTAGTISLGYSATDGDNPPATGTITLMAVDTPVKFTAPAADDLIITENDSTNAWTVTITATSIGSDSNGMDSAISGYEILEVLDADGMAVDMNGVFSITDAGVISVSGALDHETSAYYTLRIQATDTAESAVPGDTADTGTTDLRVNVGDVNEADPVIEGSPTADAFVTTGATDGTEVTTVVVTDADTSQTFTYAITSGNTGDAFAIDDNGVITVASGTTLDRATTATYDLVVTVTDNGVDASGAAATKSDTQNIKVTVREEAPTPIAEQVQGASVQSGTDAADVIDRGTQTGFEVIQGGDLSDTITVGSGGSVVFGGYGSDAITLGDGVDTVVHRFASVKGIWRNDDGADVIRDFELGKDKFILVDTDDNPIDLTTFLDETISGSHSILGPDDMQPIAERGAAGVLIRALPDLDADDLTYIGVAITISTPVKQDGPGGEDPNTAAIEIQIYWDESFVIDPNGTPDADNYERFLGIVDLVGFTGGQLNLENDFTDYSILPTYLNDDDTTRGFDVISLDDLGVEII